MIGIKKTNEKYTNEELESLWSENTISSLVKFYSEVNTPDKAVAFSGARHLSEVKIYHNNVGTDTCFVIPTMNFDKFRKTTYWNFVSQLDTIIVESNGPYFNYSHSMNSGIVEVLNYGYSRVILSNDDMIPLSPIGELEEVIRKTINVDIILPKKIKISEKKIFPIPEEFYIVERNLMERILTKTYWIKVHKILAKNIIQITKNFSDYNYSVFENGGSTPRDLMLRLLLKTKYSHLPLFNSFGIFKTEILHKAFFDTLFINGREDYDLVIRLLNKNFIFQYSSFEIADIGGQSLNNYYNNLRPVKNRLNDLILNFKLRKLHNKSLLANYRDEVK